MAQDQGAEPQGAHPAAQQGGSPAQSNEPSDERLTTAAQTVLNRLIKEDKLTWRKENDALKQTVEGLQADLAKASEKITGFDQFLAELNTEPDSKSESPWDVLDREIQPPKSIRDEKLRHMWTELAKRDYTSRQQLSLFTQKLEDLEKALENEKQGRTQESQRRAEAETARREAEKRALLSAIAAELEAVDPVAVFKLFKDDVAWDDKTQQFLFRSLDGDLVEPGSGIKKVFPDYLRRPAIATGGSGANGGRGAAETPETQLKQAQAARDQTQARANQTHSARDIAEFQKAERRVRELERQLKAA